MPVVMVKPDALSGPVASVTCSQAQGLFLGLARHFDPALLLPSDVLAKADRAAKQVAERAAGEPAFAGRLRHAAVCAARLLVLAGGVLRRQATVDLLSRSLEGLGFDEVRTADVVLSAENVDAIYGATTGYERLRPELISYLSGERVRVIWLVGDQHPAALQHWKTYVRHLLLERPPGGGHLLRNLVHVCEGADADYLTRLYTAKEEPHG